MEVGRSLSFNGTSGKVTLPSSLASVTFPYTISFLINLPAGGNCPVTQLNFNGSAKVAIGPFTTGGYVICSNNNSLAATFPLSLFNLSTWQLWTVVYTGVNQFTFYLDGKSLGTPTGTADFWQVSTVEPFTLCRNGSPNDRWLNCQIANFAIFNVALTAEQARELYERPYYLFRPKRSPVVHALQSTSQIYNFIAAGGALGDGQATAFASFAFTPTSGATCAGQASLQISYNITPLSGALIGGSATCSAVFQSTPTGGSALGGIAIVNATYSPLTGGGVKCGIGSFDETGSGGATANGSANISDDYFNPLRHIYLRFTTGDVAYVKSRHGQMPSFRNKRTIIKDVAVLTASIRYMTDLGDFDDDDLLSIAEQKTAMEQDKAAYLRQLHQRLS